MTHEDHDTAAPDPASLNRPARVPLGERIQFLLVGGVIGMTLGLAVSAALRPLAGQAVARSLGTGMTVLVTMVFSEGYPRVSLRTMAVLFVVWLACGLLIAWVLG